MTIKIIVVQGLPYIIKHCIVKDILIPLLKQQVNPNPVNHC